tara:strand:- start:3110 stop:3604 length:495 start_codon:yes stop_codon:yes gene_type:complete
MGKKIIPNREAQINWILNKLQQGKKRIDFMDDYLAKFGTSTSMMDKNIKQAKDRIDSEKAMFAKKLEQSIDKRVDEITGKILSQTEIMITLSKIISGEVLYTKPMVVDGQVVEVPVAPDYQDRKNAAAELNKMRGDYEAAKMKVELDNQLIITKRIITRDIDGA